MKIRLHFPLILILYFFLSLPFTVYGDFFTWELQIFAEGSGGGMEIVPVKAKSSVYQWSQGECRFSNSWTRIESELTMEGKTLVCSNHEDEEKVSLVCRDNHGNRLYNRRREFYPETISEKLFLGDAEPHESPFLRLRCFF